MMMRSESLHTMSQNLHCCSNDQFLVQSAQFCFRSSTEATIYPLVEAPHYHPPCHHLASVSTTNCRVYDAVYRINSHNRNINNFNIQSGKKCDIFYIFLTLPIASKNTFSMQANADCWRQRTK